MFCYIGLWLGLVTGSLQSQRSLVISQNFKCAVFWEGVSGYARKDQESGQ
jgi:hypothetical protein